MYKYNALKLFVYIIRCILVLFTVEWFITVYKSHFMWVEKRGENWTDVNELANYGCKCGKLIIDILIEAWSHNLDFFFISLYRVLEGCRLDNFQMSWNQCFALVICLFPLLNMRYKITFFGLLTIAISNMTCEVYCWTCGSFNVYLYPLYFS